MAPLSSSSAVSSAAPNTITIEEDQAGFCGVNGVIDTKHAGYKGSGFIDTVNEAGATIEWQVNASELAEYSITIRYALAEGASRGGTLVANGNAGVMAGFDLAPTGAWTKWAEETRAITLNAGSNRLVMTADTAAGFSNIDSISISGPAVAPEACAALASSSSMAGQSSSTATSAPYVPPIGTGTTTPKQSSTQLIGFATLNGGTTGGAGGKVVMAGTGSQINAAICGRAAKDTPIIIQVNGTINHGNTSKSSGSCSTADDVIDLKGVSNISIIGVGNRAVFDQLGIHIRDASNIILQNLHIKNVKKSGSPTSNGGDAIGMESGVYNVWVDHCTLEASGGEGDGYDSLLDMKSTVKYVTVSYTHYRNSGRGGLLGHNDTPVNNGPATFHHNYYENMDSRLPLIRESTVHSFNNYFDGITKTGINARAGGQVKVENNYFENARNPLGTFYADESVMGLWEVGGNIFTDTVRWEIDTGNKEFYPAGPDVKSTTTVQTSYSYELDAAADVPGIVKANVGFGKL